MYTITFTGHKPNKLGGYNWNTELNKIIYNRLANCIYNLIHEQYLNNLERNFKFNFGGELGIDQMAFDILYKNKEKIESLYDDIDIKLELAISFKNKTKNWFKINNLNKYDSQKNKADILTYTDELKSYTISNTIIGEYHKEKTKQRKKYMIDSCDTLIGVWNYSRGKTSDCIKYANKINKSILIVDLRNL